MSGWCEKQDEYVPLVIRAASGHRRAFEALVRRYYRMSLGYADSILHDTHLAEDAVQEAFLGAFGALRDLREPAAFPGWLRRIVFKHCDRIRRRKRDAAVPDVEAIACHNGSDQRGASGHNGYRSPEELADEAALFERVRAAIDSLPNAQRTAAELCLIDGYTPSDVACFLEVDPTTVRKRLHDARVRLRAALEEEKPMATTDSAESVIKELFAKRLTGDRVEKLLRNPSLLNFEGESREITVLFGDLIEFTRQSDSLAPDKLVAYLNQYFTEQSKIVLEHGGFLDKMIGDEIMVLWGTPANPSDHAKQACLAALAMQEQLRRTTLDPKPRVSIGINTGEVIIGNFGPPDNVQYTPMGDHINLGSRIETLARTYGVLTIISESTRDRAGSAVRTRELDEIEVPRMNPAKLPGGGKVRLFELVARADDELSNERVETLDAYESGLESFKRGEISLARARFLDALNAAGGKDGPSLIYLTRCAQADKIIRGPRWL